MPHYLKDHFGVATIPFWAEVKYTPRVLSRGKNIFKKRINKWQRHQFWFLSSLVILNTTASRVHIESVVISFKIDGDKKL